jgi:hypothetical protein
MISRLECQAFRLIMDRLCLFPYMSLSNELGIRMRHDAIRADKLAQADPEESPTHARSEPGVSFHISLLITFPSKNG